MIDVLHRNSFGGLSNVGLEMKMSNVGFVQAIVRKEVFKIVGDGLID